MKINLIKTKDNKHLKGWDIVPENEEEKLILGTIRNAIFCGLDDTYPEYAGRESEIKNDMEYIIKLKWRIPKYEQE